MIHFKCKDCVTSGNSEDEKCPVCGNPNIEIMTKEESEILYKFLREHMDKFLESLSKDNINWTVDCAQDDIIQFIWTHYTFKKDIK